MRVQQDRMESDRDKHEKSVPSELRLRSGPSHQADLLANAAVTETNDG